MRLHYAVLSGICASSAGAFGKLSGHDTFHDIIVIRIIFFGLMLASNAAVWTLFVKALHQSESSLVATVITSTSNYLFTAILGSLLLGERVSTFWWIGMLFIITGLVLIVSSEEVKEKTNDYQK